MKTGEGSHPATVKPTKASAIRVPANRRRLLNSVDKTVQLLTLKDLTELELEKIKSAFSTIAADDGDAIAELGGVRETLDKAQPEIEDVKDNIKRAAKQAPQRSSSTE